MSTRDEILAAARDAFESGGEAALSVRDVAARVGLTPMAVYRHFENRQALLDTLVMEATTAWRRKVAAIGPCKPEQWLLKIGDAFLEFALRKPRTFEAAFLVQSESALRYPDDFLDGGSPAVSLQLQLLEEMNPSRSGRNSLKPIEMIIIIAGLAQGLVSLYRAGRIAGDAKTFAALYRRALRTCVGSFSHGEHAT